MITLENCPHCQAMVGGNDYFCPGCGEKIKDKPLPIGIFRKILIYFVSLFLPPSGYWYGFKYLREENPEAKKVGLVAIILTTFTILFTFFAGNEIVSFFSQTTVTSTLR